jgi:hypothetical protein
MIDERTRKSGDHLDGGDGFLAAVFWEKDTAELRVGR